MLLCLHDENLYLSHNGDKVGKITEGLRCWSDWLQSNAVTLLNAAEGKDRTAPAGGSRASVLRVQVLNKTQRQFRLSIIFIIRHSNMSITIHHTTIICFWTFEEAGNWGRIYCRTFYLSYFFDCSAARWTITANNRQPNWFNWNQRKTSTKQRLLCLWIVWLIFVTKIQRILCFILRCATDF